MLKKIILICVLIISVNTVAQSQDDPQKIIDQFFSLYRTKGVSESVDYLFSTNKWMEESKDQVENVKFKLNSTLKIVGKYEGHSLITKKTVGEHLVVYTFMVRYDRQPLRFWMLFYKPNNEWRIQNFKFDDQLDEELEEAAKSYRLKENIE